MNTITLQQAVDALCVDGDPHEVASLRVRRALEQGQIRSWGLLVKYNKDISPNQEIKPKDWQHLEFFDWKGSAANNREDGWYQPWRHASRVVLSLDDFNRLFFPQVPFLKAARVLKEVAVLPQRQTNAITLRNAVELLHKDGDPIDVAVIRIRRAAAARKIRSRGLLVGHDSGPWPDWFEEEDTPTQWWWNYAERIDWENSAIELSEQQQYCEESGCRFMYYSRVALDRDDFDREFFPQKVRPKDKPKKNYALAEVQKWAENAYPEGTPRPGQEEFVTASIANFPGLQRDRMRQFYKKKWGETRPGRPRKPAKNNSPK